MLIDNIPSDLSGEVAVLIKLFVAIQDPIIRQRIIELAKAISG